MARGLVYVLPKRAHGQRVGRENSVGDLTQLPPSCPDCFLLQLLWTITWASMTSECRKMQPRYFWISAICLAMFYVLSNTVPHYFLESILQGTVTKPTLGPFAQSTAKPIYRRWVVMKERTAFVARLQVNLSSCSKNQTPPCLSGKGF